MGDHGIWFGGGMDETVRVILSLADWIDGLILTPIFMNYEKSQPSRFSLTTSVRWDVTR